MTNPIAVRIIREPSNRDGWLGRNTLTNRVTFFSNLSSHIRNLEPGQVWEAHIISSRATSDIVNLTHQLSA